VSDPFLPRSRREAAAFNAGVAAAARVVAGAAQAIRDSDRLRPHKRAVWGELFAAMADDLALLRIAPEPDDPAPAAPAALPSPPLRGGAGGGAAATPTEAA
jgi:hypothetical protein